MAFAAALFSLASCKGKNEEDKKKFVNTCMQQAGTDVADPTMKGYFQEYCECSAEKVFDKYDQKDIDKMEAEARKTGSSEAMLSKLMPEIKPCLDELKKKSESAMPGAPAQ
jgi:hypothetical protein